MSSNLKNAVIAAVFLILFYAVGSRALDTGSYWQYLAAFILFAVGIKFIVRSLSKG